MSEFKGVVAATITPFTPEGEFNEAAFRTIMESNIQAGVDGFWVSGGTGESVLLTEDEVIRTAQVSAELCRGRAKAIVHVGALTTGSAVRMATGARDAGADAISCVPPFFYRPSDQAIIDYFRAVAGAADLPFFIYNQPKYTGVEFTAPLMEKMVKAIPQLAGVKHSAPDFNNIHRFAGMGLVVFTGHGSLFLPALSAGAAGVVDGPLAVAPEVWVGIYRAYLEGDDLRAHELQDKANKLIDLSARFGMQATCKVLTGLRLDIDCGVPRLPIPALSEEQREELIGAAEAIGVVKAPRPSA